MSQVVFMLLYLFALTQDDVTRKTFSNHDSKKIL